MTPPQFSPDLAITLLTSAWHGRDAIFSKNDKRPASVKTDHWCESAARILDLCSQQEGWSWTDVDPHTQRSFWEAWIDAAGISSALLSLLALEKRPPGAPCLWEPNAAGRFIGDVLFTRARQELLTAESYSARSLREIFVKFLDKTPLEEWTRHDAAGDTPGAGWLAKMMAWSKDNICAVPRAWSHSEAPLLYMHNGKPLVPPLDWLPTLKNVFHEKALLAKAPGSNLSVAETFLAHDVSWSSAITQALQHVKTNSAVTSEETSPPTRLDAALARSAFFTQCKSSVPFKERRAWIQKHADALTKEDWLTWRSPWGTTALQAGVKTVPALIRTHLPLDLKKAPSAFQQELLAQRSEAGASLWFFLLSKLDDTSITNKLLEYINKHFSFEGHILTPKGEGVFFQALRLHTTVQSLNGQTKVNSYSYDYDVQGVSLEGLWANLQKLSRAWTHSSVEAWWGTHHSDHDDLLGHTLLHNQKFARSAWSVFAKDIFLLEARRQQAPFSDTLRWGLFASLFNLSLRDPSHGKALQKVALPGTIFNANKTQYGLKTSCLWETTWKPWVEQHLLSSPLPVPTAWTDARIEEMVTARIRDANTTGIPKEYAPELIHLLKSHRDAYQLQRVMPDVTEEARAPKRLRI